MSTTSIWNILNNNVPDLAIKRGIEIPMIQRDYAQGRNNDKANEIRKVFLNNLLGAINGIKNGGAPLELDFIYGYIESERFVPLDGQQRLTTLYLLHWYLGFRDQLLSAHIQAFSRFTYQTRQSSADFLQCLCSGLTEKDHADVFSGLRSFRSMINGKNWYFISWKYDLTIQSMINMLEDIHYEFKSTDFHLNDLIDPDTPCFIFNFLDIKNFGLSDDLYIKMNSRGKPLTNFENLKAELGKFIEESDFNNLYQYSLRHSGGYKPVDVETYFVTRIDTDWTNYFWQYRNTETNAFDDKLLNLLAFVALNETAREDYQTFDVHLKELDKAGVELSYYKFHSLQLLNQKSIISYINILDLLVDQSELISSYFADKTFLDKDAIVEYAFEPNFRARYEQRVLFYAIFKFLMVNCKSLELNELLKWDRLIRNLVANANTIYNTPRDFQDSITSIDKLLKDYTGDIYQTFLDSGVSGFDMQQIKEEKLKIKLMAISTEWESLILEAEAHGYLKGQIMFLLAFCGIYERDIEVGLEHLPPDYLMGANEYFEKFRKTFKDSGLRRFENETFRRALLTKGDYLLYSTNFSLLIDSHRDISWKRLLKESGNLSSEYFEKRTGYLKELFDDIQTEDVEGSLKKMIKEHGVSDWRKDFIEHPMLIKLSYEKYLKFFNNDDIYILRKSKYNKYADPELKSLLLKKALLKKGFSDEDIELGYIESLNQYGITRIKKLKPKVAYNHTEKKFLFRQKGKEDVMTASQREIVNYIFENF